MSANAQLCVTLWTDDVGLALAGDRAGVDRIGIDVERLGKAQRQAGLGTWISPHQEEALARIAPLLRTARAFARCDPPHAETAAQVQRLLTAGATVLMLPMYRTADEVAQFVHAVDGRARVVLLLETREAVAMLGADRVPGGVDEIHVGLNDLALEHGMASRFTALASPLLDEIADRVLSAGLTLGIGGIARVDDDTLPIAPDLVYARLAALGATTTLLSRVFVTPVGAGSGSLGGDLGPALHAARACHRSWVHRDGSAQAQALTDLREQSGELVEWRDRPAPPPQPVRTG